MKSVESFDLSQRRTRVKPVQRSTVRLPNAYTETHPSSLSFFSLSGTSGKSHCQSFLPMANVLPDTVVIRVSSISKEAIFVDPATLYVSFTKKCTIFLAYL